MPCGGMGDGSRDIVWFGWTGGRWLLRGGGGGPALRDRAPGMRKGGGGVQSGRDWMADTGQSAVCKPHPH